MIHLAITAGRTRATTRNWKGNLLGSFVHHKPIIAHPPMKLRSWKTSCMTIPTGCISEDFGNPRIGRRIPYIEQPSTCPLRGPLGLNGHGWASSYPVGLSLPSQQSRVELVELEGSGMHRLVAKQT